MNKSGVGERVRVLVLHAGIRPGPWTCRSLAAAGYQVLASHHDDGPILAARSRHADDVLRYPSVRDRPEDFLEWLERTCRERAIAAVVPLSESMTHLLAAKLPSPGGSRLVGPTIEQYASVCDKQSLTSTAAPLGIKTPPGIIVTGAGLSGEWPSLPSIVKPLSSATSTGSGVVYLPAAFVETPDQREAAVERVVRACGAALVQECILGKRFRVHFVRHSEGVSAIALETIRSYPRLTGMSSVSRTMLMPPDLAQVTFALLERLAYRGPGSTQFIRRNGELYLHDVNLRLEFSMAASYVAGLDAPRLSVDDALGRPVSPNAANMKFGVHYVWLGGEAHAFLDAIRGRPTAAPLPRIAGDLLLAALSPRRVLDPFSFTDPLPMLAHLRGAVRRPRHPGASAMDA